VFSLGSYVLLVASSLVVQAAGGFLPPVGRLELTQAIDVMMVAAVASVVMFSLNGERGSARHFVFDQSTSFEHCAGRSSLTAAPVPRCS
jgi:hypothetical protein